MRGVPIGSPSRSGYALRLGARIRPTALRSFLPKPESETSLSSVVTSAGGDTKDPYCELLLSGKSFFEGVDRE